MSQFLARTTIALMILMLMIPASTMSQSAAATVTIASIASDGSQGNAASSAPSLSADGRYVAFQSIATNLVSNDTNGHQDIFVHERFTGYTMRVNVASDGSEANGNSDGVTISADGRFVVFSSHASNLVPDDANGTLDVFMHDRQSGSTERVSLSHSGEEANGESFLGIVSADGRYVAFQSTATNLVPGDTNESGDIFVRDREAGTTERVSISSTGLQGNQYSESPGISGDGRFVTFASAATNLVANDTNDVPDVFLHDREAGETRRVSVSSTGEEADNSSFWPVISADGRNVVFHSYAGNLTPVVRDNPDDIQVFLRDVQQGTTEQISVVSDGSSPNAASVARRGSISQDGRYVVFETSATDIVHNDPDDDRDIYLHDQLLGVTRLVSVTPDGMHANRGSGGGAINADGRFVAYTSLADNLTYDDLNEQADVFVAELLATTDMPAMAAPGFGVVWSRTDLPVLNGNVSRTWMWGPEPLTPFMEETYAESPDGMRAVQYFDKSRMEITNPEGDGSSPWYVTNGLLATELITGRLQVGNDSFENRQPASINVAGDPGDPDGPTYASLTGLLDAPPHDTGATLIERLGRDGSVTADPSLGRHGITIATVDSVTQHAIPVPFWAFMTSSGTVFVSGQYIEAELFLNPVYATGRPITEAYWTTVQVAGTPQDVLLQCFERRCLTYTPDNPPAWQVEAGNIGQHYFRWRYGSLPYSQGLAFTSNRTGQPDIYRFDRSRYQVRRITRIQYADYTPAWSPDGSRIAYVQDMGLGNWQLKTIDSYGDHDTTLLAEPNVFYSTPVWSPDGTKVAFIRLELHNQSRGGLFVINADGSGMTQLSPDSIDANLRPAWSPDGRKIAFTSEPKQEGQFGNNEIYVVNADGSNLKSLGDDIINGSGINWSPDGEWIAFLASDQFGASLSDICIIRPDGSDLQRLSTVNTMTVYLAWSPDSQHLAFDHNVEGQSRIHIINIDGTGMTRLTDSDTIRADIQPVWSQDGNWIAFTTLTDDYVEIYVVQPNGTAQMNLTNNPSVDSDPDWAGGP